MSLLSRFLPAQAFGQVLVWTFIPTFLFLFTLGISFLNFCPFTLYLPFFALISAAITIRYRTIGLSGSYAALAFFVFFFFKELPEETLLWQMGIIFTLALTIFILLLSVEETEACLEKQVAGSTELTDKCLKAEANLAHLQRTAEERERELQEEIGKLKEEAELRRIERAGLLKQSELIHSEILWLTSQKEAFITEAREARGAASLCQKNLEEEKQARALHEEAAVSYQQNLAKEKEELTLFHQKNLEREKEEIEARYQSAIEREKADSAVRYQTALQEEMRLAANLYQKYLEEQKGGCETQIASLKQEILSLHEALNAAQEEKTHLLKAREVLQEPKIAVSEGELADLKKELAQARGQYGQLRYQFEQKSAALSQTRKELFEAEGQLLAKEREQALSEGEPTLEVEKLYSEMHTLIGEIERLDEEIISLEALISHALSR